MHTIGGTISLAGAIALGPRLGRVFKRDGGGPMPPHNLIFGAVAAIVVVVALEVLEWFRIDDPIGAVPVHIFAEMWGTSCTGPTGISSGGRVESCTSATCRVLKLVPYASG